MIETWEEVYRIFCTDCNTYMGTLRYEAIVSCAGCYKKNMQVDYDREHRSPDVKPNENHKV